MNASQWFHNYSSSIFGVISILCWIFALFPQIHENYKIKRVSALSPMFIALWAGGDLSNMLGCILTHQTWTMLVLSIYFCLMDFILILQYIHYRIPISIDSEHLNTDSCQNNQADDSRIKGSNSIIASIIALMSILNSVTADSINEDLQITFHSSEFDHQSIGNIFGWISAIMYCVSRIPQIYKNWKRNSVKGLALWTFYAAFFGNIFYSLSILVIWKRNDRNENLLPFLIGSIGTLGLDMFILFVQGRGCLCNSEIVDSIDSNPLLSLGSDAVEGVY